MALPASGYSSTQWTSHDAGWNLDRLIVRDTSFGEYGPCGGCGGAPSFGGVQTVADDNPCADRSRKAVSIRLTTTPARQAINSRLIPASPG